MIALKGEIREIVAGLFPSLKPAEKRTRVLAVAGETVMLEVE